MHVMRCTAPYVSVNNYMYNLDCTMYLLRSLLVSIHSYIN